MDLISLPNEMLESVLKYSKNKTLMKLRGLNTRIDTITRKNKMNLLNLSSLRIIINGSAIIFTMESDESQYDRTNAELINRKCLVCSTEQTKISVLLENMLRKICKVRYLALYTFVIDEEVNNIIHKHAKILRNSQLTFAESQIIISAEKVKDLANFANLSQISICKCKFVNGIGITDNVVAAFTPRMSVDLSGDNGSLITGQSLYNRVLSNKLRLSLFFTKTAITFKDMIQFLKTFSKIENTMNLGKIQGVPRYFEDVKAILNDEFGKTNLIYQDKTYRFKPYPRLGEVRFASLETW